LNCEQENVPANCKFNGELPRATDQCGEPGGGPKPPEIAPELGDDEGLIATERINPGKSPRHGWDTAGFAEGQHRPAWPAKMHHDGGCLDDPWGSVLEVLRPILLENGLAAEGGIGGAETSGVVPHYSTPLKV